jgi:hypothetical protein
VINAAVDVGVLGLVVAGNRVDHLPRLLRGRAVVEVDQRSAVALDEDREVGANDCGSNTVTPVFPAEVGVAMCSSAQF